MSNKLPVITALLAGAVIALAAVLVLGGGDDDDKSATSTTKVQPPAELADGTELKGPNDAFTLRYPKSGWQQLKPADFKANAGAVAGIKRSDNNALLLIEQRGKLEQPLAEVPDTLTKQLEKQVKDFRFVESGELTLPSGGKAMSYTFVRTKSNRVQNLVVVPQGNTTFTLNSVVGGKAEDAARQVAAIVKTFDPEKD